MGLTPMITREMARFKGGAHTPDSIRDLLRTVEMVCLGLAMLICAGVFLSANLLAAQWLRPENLSPSVVAQALGVMGLVVALRFCESLYRGVLFGLQEQVWFSVANGVLTTLRHVGGLALVAFLVPTVEAFFVWQGAVSMLCVLVFGLHAHRKMPRAERTARFSFVALRGKLSFAGYTLVNTLLAILLTQTDKVLVSGYLPLEEFAYFMLASSIGAALYMLIVPLTSALYPRLTELVAKRDDAATLAVYHRGAQMATILVVPIGAMVALFAHSAVLVWSGDAELARHIAPMLAPVILGNLLNCMMYMPFQLLLANGLPKMLVQMNLVAVAVLGPALVQVLPAYGAVGAAWLWVALNAGYLVLGIEYMHRRLYPAEKWIWWLRDLGLPCLGIVLVLVPAYIWAATDLLGSRGKQFAFFAIFYVLSTAVALICASSVRREVWSLLKPRIETLLKKVA